MKRLRAARPTRAFTLIEVLLATLTFALILATVNTAFFTALRLRERSAERADLLQPRLQALDWFKRDLSNAFYSEAFLAERFLGEPDREARVPADRLLFYVTSKAVGPAAQLPARQIQYYLTPAERTDGRNQAMELLRAETSNLLTDQLPPPLVRRLASGLSSMTFEFFDGEFWTTGWDSDFTESPLPRAVRVRLEFAPETAGESPLILNQTITVLAEPKPPAETEAETEENPPETAGGDR